MLALLTLVGLLLLLPAVAVRLIDLTPTRLGALAYYPLVLGETFNKRVGGPHGLAELASFLVGGVLLGLTWRSLSVVLALLALVLVLDIRVRYVERTLLSTAYLRQDQEKMRGVGQPYPSPSTHPDLTLNLVGPFVERTPHYDLGTIVAGRTVVLELIVGNHSIVPLQIAPKIQVKSDAGLKLLSSPTSEVPLLRPGQVHRLGIHLQGCHEGSSGKVEISLTWGDRDSILSVRHGRCVPVDGAQPVTAEIIRYPNGARSALAWRGDMDVYDTSTFQSISGLETTLGLAARYRFPQTMFLSTRLTVSFDEAKRFWDHWGLDRGHDEIPAFIEWMQQRVDLRHELTYPFESDKPYAIELGNHGHLHYGTDMAADAANGWKPQSKIGAGMYPWVGEAQDSESEQRDNALEANRLSEELFDFPLRSWAMPDRTTDEHTAAAMWAAGCEVLSDSDITAADNVLRQPPPHHPNGTDAVELTKRYPGDPDTIHQVAMIKYWIHRGHRRRIPVLFMCHQHMVQWAGYACTRFTEHLLQYVLTQFNGDLHINTVYGVGTYWNETMSPRNRTVTLRVDGSEIVVENSGKKHLRNVPVDVNFGSAGSATYLVELPPGSVRRLGVTDA